MLLKQQLYGRTEEIQTIQDILHRSQESPQVLLVAGPSGTGKTTLIETVFGQANCLLGKGKFGREHVSCAFSGKGTPFYELRDSLADIAGQIQGNEQYNLRLKHSAALKLEDLRILSSFIPSFTFRHDDAEVMLIEETREGSTAFTTALAAKGTKAYVQHLKFALKELLKVVAMPECPVVLFLDDITWTDQDTLEIISAIQSDPELKHLVVAGAYRDDEVDQDHLLMQWFTPEMEVINLGNLSVKDLQQAVEDCLPTDGNIQELADLMHSRTMGNPHHLVQLLDFLMNHKKPVLLNFSQMNCKWSWDIDLIRQHTSLSDNVLRVIEASMKQLPQDCLECLKLASCLGQGFDERTLVIAGGEQMKGPLEKCVQVGLLERVGHCGVMFVHDKVHQAAHDLIPTREEQIRQHYKIGIKLAGHFLPNYKERDSFSDVKDASFFACIDQLNLGRPRGVICQHSAKLNCEAARRAAKYAAFQTGIKYALEGIMALKDGNEWENHYELCLELYTLLAELSANSGQVKQLEDVSEQVIGHARTVEDKIRAFLASLSLAWGSCSDKVIQSCKDFLEELGEFTLPSTSFKIKRQSSLSRSLSSITTLTKKRSSEKDVQAMRDASFKRKREAHASMKRTVATLEKRSDEDILSLPTMSCIKQSTSIRLIAEIYTVEFYVDKPTVCATDLSHAIDMTLEHGLSSHAPVLFAHFGLHMMTHDFPTEPCFRLGLLALKMLDHIEGSEAVRARVLTMVAYVRSWKTPLSHHLDEAHLAYQLGMRTGDLEAAFFGVTTYALGYIYSGLPLDPFVADMKDFMRQAATLGQKVLLFLNVPVYQFALNLTGNSDELLDLSRGEAARYRVIFDWDKKVGKEAEWSYSMQVAFWCGEVLMAHTYAEYLKDVHKVKYNNKRFPFYFGQVRVFYFALIAIEMARRSGKTKYVRQAKKYTNQIREMIYKDGSINLPHKLLILEAELASLDGLVVWSPLKGKSSRDELVSRYDKAIAASRKSGFLQDAAVAAMLASNALDDAIDRARYEDLSNEFWETWGARAVLGHLLEARRAPIRQSSSSSSVDGVGYRSRRRFTESIQKQSSGFAVHRSSHFYVASPFSTPSAQDVAGTDDNLKARTDSFPGLARESGSTARSSFLSGVRSMRASTRRSMIRSNGPDLSSIVDVT